MIGIPLGLLYGNVSEWAIHKYVLHEKGKNKKHFSLFIGMCTTKTPARTKTMIGTIGNLCCNGMPP